MRIKDALILAIEIITDRQQTARDNYMKIGDEASYYNTEQYIDMIKCKQTLEKTLEVVELL